MPLSKLNIFRNLILLTGLICLSNISIAQQSFSAGELKMGLNKQGSITELSNSSTGKNYLSTDTLSPIITLVSNDKRYQPGSMTYDKIQKKITLAYPETGVSIDIRVSSKNTHLVLEIIRASPENKIDAISWGPIPNTISKTIGEIIGVVRDGETDLAPGLTVGPQQLPGPSAYEVLAFMSKAALKQASARMVLVSKSDTHGCTLGVLPRCAM